MKIIIIAIIFVVLIGLAIFLLPTRTNITVSNAAFIELVENNKIENVLFTSGNEEVIGYSRDNGPLVYTYTDTTNYSDHPPKLYEMLKKYKDKVRIELDYAPVDDNFQGIINSKK